MSVDTGVARATPVRVVDSASRTASDSARRLFGRDMWYVLLSSVQLLITALMSPVLAHVIAPDAFGLVATALAIYQFLLVLGTLGFDQVVVIYDADPALGPLAARRTIALAWVFAGVVCAATLALGPFWIHWLGIGRFSGPVAIAVLWCAPGAANLVGLAYLRAHDRLVAYCAVGMITGIGGQLAGLVLCLAFDRSAAAYAWGGVATQVLGLAIMSVLVRPRPPRRSADWTQALRAFRFGAPLAITAVALYALNAGDRVIVQHFLGERAVARYQVAYIVGSAVIIVLSVLSQTWLPRLLQVADDIRSGVIRAALVSLQGVVAPLVVAVAAAAPILLAIVAPPTFDPEQLGVTVALVALAALPFADAACTGLQLIAARRARHVAVATVAAALANIALNVWLVPRMGLSGSALATLLAFGAQAAVQRIDLIRLRHGSQWSLDYAAIVVAAVPAAVAAPLLPRTANWLVLRAMVSVVLVLLAGLRLRSAWSTPGRHRAAS